MTTLRFSRDFSILAVLLSITFACSLVPSMVAGAEDYPTRAITIHVGFPPAGAAGPCAQIFAETAKKYLPKSQPIIVNYKPGAASAVAADFVLKQPADGYNLFWFPPDLAGKLAKDGPQLSFKMEDFIPIGTFAATPTVLVVNKENKAFMRLEDFVDAAKKNPMKYSYGSVGIGGIVHLGMEIVMQRTGIKLNHIPFAGGAAATAALLGGHTDVGLISLTTVRPHVAPEGGLRGLAILGPQRLEELPDIPSIREKGYDNIDRSFWYYLSAPKGTPQPVLNILLEVFNKTAKDPQVKAVLHKAGYVLLNLNPEETKQRAREEFDLARKIYAQSDLK